MDKKSAYKAGVLTPIIAVGGIGIAWFIFRNRKPQLPQIPSDNLPIAGIDIQDYNLTNNLEQSIKVTKDEVDTIISNVSTDNLIKIQELKNAETKLVLESQTTQADISRLQSEIAGLQNQININTNQYNQMKVNVDSLAQQIKDKEVIKSKLYNAYYSAQNTTNNALEFLTQEQYVNQELRRFGGLPIWSKEKYQLIGKHVIYNGTTTKWIYQADPITLNYDPKLGYPAVEASIREAEQKYNALLTISENTKVAYTNAENEITNIKNTKYEPLAQQAATYYAQNITALNQILLAKQSTLDSVLISYNAILKNIELIAQKIKELA